MAALADTGREVKGRQGGRICAGKLIGCLVEFAKLRVLRIAFASLLWELRTRSQSSASAPL